VKLGTRLTLYLSLVIILVLSGYGYFHVHSRRETLKHMMQIEVRSIGEILRVSLEKISLPRELAYVQELLDAVSEPERTLGGLFAYAETGQVFRSQSLEGEIGALVDLVTRAIQEDRPREEFGIHRKVPVFSYSFPLRDKKGKLIGGVAVIQNASFMEKDIQNAARIIFFIILVLIGGVLILILFFTRKWITLPFARLRQGIQAMSGGDLDTQIDLRGRDEVSGLARAFNQLASSLKEARQRIAQEGESRLELERNLRQSEKLATIGQLASELAHEIGTPLNIIGGRAELTLRRIEDPESIRKNLDIISRQAERITRIIQQLLGFVRKKRVEKRPLKILHVLENTLTLLEQKIEKQGVRVVKNIPSNLPPVQGDADQLQQVFLNLILNALQAMPRGGTLRLSASSGTFSREGLQDRGRPCVEVLVEDTGGGMDKEVLGRIFTPFFTTKIDEKGTGLGLTVTQGIVQEHDGWIEVQSEAAKGSRFKVYLPEAQSDPKGEG
jgi:signal transduction histidine kinase